MDRFGVLRPVDWAESIEATLDAIAVDGVCHVTEVIVTAFTGDAPKGALSAVSELLTRAVVLAAEVERLRAEVQEQTQEIDWLRQVAASRHEEIQDLQRELCLRR